MKSFIKRNRKIIIKICLSIFLLAIVFSAVFGGKCSICGDKTHVIHKYRQTIGLPSYGEIGSPSFDYIVSFYGEPMNIEYVEFIPMTNQQSRYRINLVYPSFKIQMTGTDRYDEDTWQFCGIILSDATYGTNGVHVGISKAWVIWKCRHLRKINEYALGEAYFQDSGCSEVYFEYNRFGFVSSIAIYGL